MMIRPSLSLVLIVVCSVVLIRSAGADQNDLDFFETKIRPILHEHCYSCHSDKKQWSGLRLDSLSAILKGGDNGPAIVPGDPSASLLMKAVERRDGLEMPPDYKLTDGQIADLKIWIQAGAKWPTIDANGSNSDEDQGSSRKHWAFQPIAQDFSSLFGSQVSSNLTIDDFLDLKRREAGIGPLKPADPKTLIRRLSFDLTGLPPDYSKVLQFEQNPAPEQYASIVDELLNSPQFGEQMARMWLDIARYSDTKGYVYAREERFQVHANTYRDWVIRAFHSDLPYDRFLQYQIAADRYASHDPSHLAAMGFLTLGRRFLGVTHDIIDDRIDVVTRSTLGLTVSCARCHDHKYDPIPTEDYYSFYGVFHNSTERQIELVDDVVSPPASNAEWRAELIKRQATLNEQLLKSRQEASNRVRTRLADYLYSQSELHKFPEEGFDQVFAVNDLIPAFVRRWERYLASVRSSENHSDQAIFKPWFLFSALPAEEFEARAMEIVKSIQSDPSIHPWIAREFGNPPQSLREVADRYGLVLAKVREERESVGANELNAKMASSRSLQSEPFVRLLYSASSPCEVPDEGIVSIEGFFDSATCTEMWRLQGEVDRWRINSNPNQRVAVGLFDRQAIVLPRIFKRGVPANKGKVVDLHYLTMFPQDQHGTPTPFRIGSGRWELADQITRSDNPLTSRVWVNRLWQHFFGQGIVKSTSDFGLRSDAPSHPELLDWLANDLVQNGWSTKSIIRKIVLSRAYQLSSGVDVTDRETITKLLDADPENRLVWRHSPRRLRWEEQCDTILSVSGRLEITPRFEQERRVAGSEGSTRRALYGFVDRQFLPNALRVFDFANPDLSIGRRSETTIPQQSLYFLNNSFVANNVRAVAKKSLGGKSLSGDSLGKESPLDYETAITQLFPILFQRQPTEQETQIGLQFLKSAEQTGAIESREIDPWTYGVCKLDVNAKSMAEFKPLPHFNGTAWQGGSSWPDSQFGWAQLTAEGGHPGNDLSHAVVRRWTAPEKMTVSIASLAKHQPDIADGVRFHIFHNEDKLLTSVQLKASESRLDLTDIHLEQGDRLNFVVDIVSELNTDQFLWAPVITKVATAESATSSGTATDEKPVWNSQSDFRGPEEYKLSPWEQFVHVLMCSNEFLFVD
ncbi:MAG: PSD1 and planctomycete cytochrome C domain-containing protein [Pirellula sp.]|nr:PSD1 and planctomycete cytochrome C domain-containing protein [Pirellula sp.]